MTPASTLPKMMNLVAQLVHFEQAITDDLMMCEVLPTVYAQHEERYAGYTIRRLCQEMHDFYKARNVKELQKKMFREEFFPKVACAPDFADAEFTRGNVELVPLKDIIGRVAAEGALPYPPGILCVVPGESWGPVQRDYFAALEEGINQLPGFAPEIQGVHPSIDSDGKTVLEAYVLKPSVSQ
jgi:ornithine decarboxylase